MPINDNQRAEPVLRIHIFYSFYGTKESLMVGCAILGEKDSHVMQPFSQWVVQGGFE